MRLSPSRDLSVPVSLTRALTVATCWLVLAACSTTPIQPTPPVDAEPATPTPVTAGAESREDSEPEPAATPTPTPAPETEPAAQPEPAATPADARTESAEIAPAPTAVQPASTTPAPEPEPPSTVALSGRVNLDVSRVEDVDDDSVRDTVIYFKPVGPSMSVEPSNFQIVTQRKRLLPDVLVIPVGSTVAFPNRDDILHNVFSVSSAADFDLGLYGEGESKSHTFEAPGLAVIHCNVHHAMRADVLVVDTPYFTRADADGRFYIEGIEPTAGELVAWHPRAGFLRRQVNLPAERTLELEVALTRPRIPDHLDKTGRPYRPERPSGR